MKLAWEVLRDLAGLTLTFALTLAVLLGLDALLAYWGHVPPI